MRLLVTAGNTQVPIDSVRCITNIFTGRTGARLALYAHEHGHDVTLFTSHPETIRELVPPGEVPRSRWRVEPYRTFDDLHNLMERTIPVEPLDVIIHCAAVSDYLSAGIYAPGPGVKFDESRGTWSSEPRFEDRSGGKVKSDEPELWLRLVRAPKLIDLIRSTWKWTGTLVKFKLEVARTDAELLAIAERSRAHSNANLMVANTFEEANQWAFLGPIQGHYQKIPRPDLPRRLFEEIERLRPGERGA